MAAPTGESTVYACLCEEATDVTGMAFQGFPPVTIRFPLAPTLGELAAKPTERVKFALSAPFRGTSPIGRGKTLICLQRGRLSFFYAASA